MAPIQKHFSSHVEENSSSASSKAFTTSSSFHTVKTSSSHNSAIASESKAATNSDQPQTRISLLENQADREVMLPITSRGHFHRLFLRESPPAVRYSRARHAGSVGFTLILRGRPSLLQTNARSQPHGRDSGSLRQPRQHVASGRD
nr:uncharacterized protein LOC113812729 [Penaeus vannamei]